MDRRWALAAVVAAASLASGIWLGRGVQAPQVGRPPPGLDAVAEEAPEPPTTPGTILVHVAGWVTDPGVVSIPETGRVGDAVVAAGGVRPGADLDQINLAEMLTDGQRVSVPGPGGEAADIDSSVADGAVTGDGRIRLNSATAEELERLPGVGPVLAERIVSHRQAAGPFQQVEDLLDVAGIGEAKLAALREHVVVP